MKKPGTSVSQFANVTDKKMTRRLKKGNVFGSGTGF
jgi:hypothetical protein